MNREWTSEEPHPEWLSPHRYRRRKKPHVSTLAIALGATVLLLAVIGFAVFWWLTAPVFSFKQGDSALEGGDPAQGRLVFTAGLCTACHATPGQDDPTKLGGGLALASPFGTFRPPNISPDPIDGIGAWSPADFANALVDGVSPKGEHYYPAFPYIGYTSMKVGDIRDLYAYLRTLPPVQGKAPPHDLPMIFRIRRLLGGWKLLFFKPGETDAKLSTDPLLERGSYLAEALSHCAECHSTRNFLGAVKPSSRYAGGPDPEGTGFVPNITSEKIGGWSEAEIAELLKSGNTPDHGKVGSSMADVVSNYAALPDEDRRAVARYIKSLPPRPTPHP